MIVTESQPVASDHQETQLLCSPTQLLHTTAAIETLAKVDAVDQRLQEAHGFQSEDACAP